MFFKYDILSNVSLFFRLFKFQRFVGFVVMFCELFEFLLIRWFFLMFFYFYFYFYFSPIKQLKIIKFKKYFEIQK